MTVEAAPDDALLAAAVARSPSIAAVCIRRGAVAETGALWRQAIGDRPALIIADENTWAAAGPAVAAALDHVGIAHRSHVLPGIPRPKPARELGARLADVARRAEEAFLAIGSGVINDLAKYAAFTAGRPYLCVATAASMDGYTSAGAPLSDQGFKITLPCRPPVAVIGDLDVIAAAPAGMAGWGYGDLAGKVPAGADWIIADALGIEAIDGVAWPMVQDRLRDWLADPAAVAAGAPTAVAGLFTGLALVGLAMEAHGSSRPASGADHQIAHLWEMEGLSAPDGTPISHGACVAVGCVTVLRLYDWLLDQDLSVLDPAGLAASAPGLDARRAMIADAFADPFITARAAEETAAKHIDRAQLQNRLARLARVWPGLRDRLGAQLVPATTMAQWLRDAGAPADASSIGVSPAHLRRTIEAARFLRRRYTVLDLLDETGLLPAALDATLTPR